MSRHVTDDVTDVLKKNLGKTVFVTLSRLKRGVPHPPTPRTPLAAALAFDPTLPANNSPISSSELRNQLNGLNNLMIAYSAAASAALETAVEGTAQNPAGMETLVQTISNPPTQAEVQAIQNKLNELIETLMRPSPI